MIMIDAGDFFLVEPSEIYAEQIREYRRDFWIPIVQWTVAVRYANARILLRTF